jgi:CRP-like cAMP-binding protein
MSPAENRILASLPSADQERIGSKLEWITLGAEEVLYEQEEIMKFVYFPTSAVVSMLSVMEDGASVEGATIGNEGIVGVSIFLGMERAIAKVMNQIPGKALRMKATEFQKEVRSNKMLNALVGRYTNALLAQIFRSAGCNRLHSVEERCARWLLMTYDRALSEEIPYTQELLAEMLGVRRPSVSVVAGAFQKAGLIRYSRGKIWILNLKGLKSAACECYGIIKEEFDRFLT